MLRIGRSGHMRRKFIGKILGIGMAVILAFGTVPVSTVKAEELPAAEVYYGDVNDDGKIDAKDVTALRRYLAGGWNVDVNEEKADADGDGAVGTKDVTILRRYITGGWGVTLPSKPVIEPHPVALRQSTLNSLNIVFDAPISQYSRDYVTAYYMSEGEKTYLNVLDARVDYEDINELNVLFDSYFPQGEMIYIEYKGVALNPIKSVVVTEDSVAAIEVLPLRVTAGREGTVQYRLLDQNGIDITGLLDYIPGVSNSVLNGWISIESIDIPFGSYLSGNRVYVQEPNLSFKILVKYNWTDKNGVLKYVGGQGTVVSVPEEPWQISFMGAITHKSDQDLVSDNHRYLNYYGNKISSLSLDTEDAVLQIAVMYNRQGETWIDTRDSVRGLNIASYPNQKVYLTYDLKSKDESVVKIGSCTENKTDLEITGVGETIILAYGILIDGSRDVIGAIPVKVRPAPNPLLNNLGESYVYNNTLDSEIRVTTSDAESFVTSDGKFNNSFKDAECCIDTPEANVIQIAVPYTNVDGTVYAGLEKAPLSTEFSEYVLESSDTNVIELSEIVSGKLQFTCKDIGMATITLYGKASDGTKTLLATKEVKVSRSKVNSPEVKSVRQVGLDSVEIIFDRDVTNEKLWTEDFARYYILTGVNVRLYDSIVESVIVKDKMALVKYASKFLQDNEYFIEFNSSLAGSFTALKFDSTSVATVVVDEQNIQPNCLTSVGYHLLDDNGIDITDLLNGTLTGTMSFRIKEQERYPFALLEGSQIYIANDSGACTVEAVYSWVDAEGITQEVKGEAVISTGNGSLLPSISSYEQGNYPAEPIPVRIETYTYSGSDSLLTEKKINAAYSADMLNILVKVFDQYGQSIDGVTVNVEEYNSGSVIYSGQSTTTSGSVFTISGSDVSGAGVLNLKVSYGDGSGELTKIVSLLVGDETTAVKYVPVLSKREMDVVILEDSVPDSINIRLEGVSENGYRTAGASLRFIEVTPRAGSDFWGQGYISNEIVYTVSKDGRVMKSSEIPTLDPGTNTFRNAVSFPDLYDGAAVLMSPGTYVVNVYCVRNVNGKVVPDSLGSCEFKVVDNQPKLSISAKDNIEKLDGLNDETIKSAFLVTFDGKIIDEDKLRFDYTVNGNKDTAYVKSVCYTVENKNGLGKRIIVAVVDALAKTLDGSSYPEAEHTEPLSDWEFESVASIVTDDSGSDYVVNGSINKNCVGINPLSMDYSGTAVLQIAASYTNNGVTVTEAPGATGYSGYTGYYLRSSNEKVVMLGDQVAENKVRLILNKEGEANILVYGVRNDGYMEYLDEIPIEVVAARKATTFDVYANKSMINLAYASDAIDFRMVVKDQYGNEMKGQNVRVERMINGQGYGLATTDSGVYWLNAYELAGNGVSAGTMTMRFICMGSEMQKIFAVMVGNEAVATNYKLSLSNLRMSITNADPSRQQAVYVYLQGKAKGFDLPGAPLFFSETVPTTDPNSLSEEIRSLLDTNEIVHIFTVKKDYELQKASDLPTFDGHAFYNCIQDVDGDVLTMGQGQYNVTAYQIKSQNGLLVITLEDMAAFTVTE